MGLEENKATAKLWLTSIATGDAAVLRETMTEDLVHELMGTNVLAGTRNRDELCMFAGQLFEATAGGVELTFLAATAEADRVALALKSHADMRAGGEYNNTYHILFYFRGDKICHVKEYADSKVVDDLAAKIAAKAST